MVLDLCCGEGSTATHMAKEKGWQVHGLDNSESAIRTAQGVAAKAGASVTFTCASAFELPYADGEFDML